MAGKTNKTGAQAAVGTQQLSCRSAVGLSRAQAAVELLAYAAFFLLAFVSVVAVFFQLQSQELSRAQHAYAQEISYSIADSIRTALVAGPGFWEAVSIAPDILGKPYNITISRRTGASDAETGFVYVQWHEGGRESSFSSPTVTGAYNYTASGSFITHDSSDFIVVNPCAACANRLNISNRNGSIWVARAS